MRKTKQLLCVLMMLTILVSSFPFSASALQTNDDFSDLGMGDLSLETENTDNPYVISTVDDYFELKDANQTGKKDVAATSASTLPSSADNSQSPYFPVIDTQGSLNSCVPFASSYYQFTYEINRARKVTTTKDNSFSPKWAFNFLCHGTGSGTNYAQVYGILKQHGCPTLKTLPYDAKDYLSWSTDEKVWREAMRYRLADYQLFEDIGKDGKDITSPDDEDLLAIKTALSNGDILGCSTYITSLDKGKKKLKANANAPENDKYLNEQYLSALPSTEGGHRMTIVGYNDNLWCDINDNNAIDDGEMGALKVANSWGTNWGNKGFIWISYDSLNDVSCVEGVAQNSKRRRVFDEITRIDVSVNEGNDIYAKLTVNTANRSRFYAVFSASLHGSEFSRYMLDDARYFGTTDKHAFNGTTTACDATFLYPLNDLSPALTTANFEDYDFTITVKDGQDDPSTVIVKGVSLVNEYTGKEYKVSANYPITINSGEWSAPLKNKTTDNVVVYYVGFDEPNLHYKKSGSTFTKVKMEENDERYGYLYKYVIEDTSSVDLYFSDDSGKIDDNSGNNYKAVAGLNYYFTKGQHEELKISDLKVSNGTPDIKKRCELDFNVTGGYEPYQYKYTMEDLSTGAIKTVNYNVKYENSPLKFENETTYKITVEVMDYAQQTAQTSILVDVTDQPFVIKSIISDKPNHLVSKPVTFSSITEFEGLLSGPHKPESRFVIKDSTGNVWLDEVNKYSSSNYLINSTTTSCTFTPQKAGEYTLTVSSTDYYKEYAEKTINFKVSDMVYGDADGNGTINVIDATVAQRYLASIITTDEIYLDLADCDKSSHVNITDATIIQRYVAQLSGTENVGKLVDYTPTVTPTEPQTQPTEPTVKPTTAPVTGNQVTFTNSLNWSGTLYCYYWSDSNTSMVTWPGKAMTKSGTNEYGETLYTFDVPKDVKYIIFTNGTSQTVDITYPGGAVKYYAQSSKTGNGHNVGTW